MSHTPSHNISHSRSLSDGEGSGNPGSKRKRSGTVRGRAAPLPLISLDATLSENMEVDLGKPSANVLVSFGSLGQDGTALPPVAYETLALALGEALQERVPMGNVVLARYILADPQDQWTLTRQIEKSFNDGMDPTVHLIRDGVFPMKLWTRPLPPLAQNLRKKVQNKALVDNIGITQRCVENRSFVICGQLAQFWPPPIVVGPEDKYDVLWSFKVTDPAAEHMVIAAMGLVLNRRYNGYFGRRVRCVWIGSAINRSDAKHSSIGKVSTSKAAGTLSW
jgi:hypothetical protein